eukprot:CAMPEP_0168455404 /NCGR_PEP_ID=MMETSP0228-20121227/50732_1 /TAXON_ID=133427 /ORGANISM="Protoceratium reticulatum, Strain CCCM 535 (=CCMP 1889)" /LENGTH=495 /DNA_ID=CAMNT_0008470247 /DNA_START=83 /DNA_END=1570 /DNA_ORIENTATION=-
MPVPASKGGAGGQETWSKAEHATDCEPGGVKDDEKVNIAHAAAGERPLAEAGQGAAPNLSKADDEQHLSPDETAKQLQAKQLAAQAEESKRGDGETEAIANTLCIANGLFMTAVTMVVPTRAPMVLAIKNGDAAGTARTMGLMSSCAAVVELFVNPIFGRLADKYGRKPFLLGAPILDAMLHFIVAANPKSLRTTFMDRVITGSMIYCFQSPVSACLCDLFGTGQNLAEWTARSGAFFGIGCAVGPFIGAKLGGGRSFFWSSITFLVTLAWLAMRLPETLMDKKRKEFELSACSPLRFLKLFRQKMTARLAATIGMQSFGDYLNIYDINFLYMKTVMGYGQAEVGNFATAVGVSQIASGVIMQKLLRSSGQKVATLAGNAIWAVAMGLLGTSRSAAQLAMALVAMAGGGHNRSAGVGAYLQRHGQAQGMGAAEITGAQANLTAVIKVVVPILYGNLFAWATSGGCRIPGLPYFLIAVMAASAQMVFSSVDPEKER